MGRQLLLLLLAGALTAGFLVMRRPVLVVENRLVEPIRLVVGNDTREVAPGGTLETKVGRRGPLVVQWYLVRPSGPSGPLGVEVQGSLTVERPRGRIERTITAASGSEPIFAPLISNAADQPLAITVNRGSARAMRCDCRVNPGATRARIGYYPLYRNSSVSATLAGVDATFQDLGDKVNAEDGTVGLRFAAENFPGPR